MRAAWAWCACGLALGWGEAGAQSAPRAAPLAGEAAARAAAAPRETRAVRAAEDVTVDGRDAEAVWAGAPVTGGFRQYEPELDAEPSFPTEFRVAYDADDLFVFVRAYDASPDSILHALSRRDVRGPSDQIGVLIDSYADRRTGFAFYVNPDGVKRDFAVFGDDRQDDTWDGVWDVAARVDSLGWTAEFRIPLSQLRYASAARHTFGFGVRREIERRPEGTSWPAYSRVTPGLMSQLGTLEGLEGLGSAQHVELTPYLVTKNVTRPRADGSRAHAQEITGGADLELVLTPNVTLLATVNPDFGQVEADPAVVNLEAFETFFEERRPFFVEGTGLYEFRLNCYIVVDCNTNEGLFYSRRIGRSPTLLAEHGDASTPAATPIAAAAKLTGRTGGGLSFGVLEAVTRRVEGVGGLTVEPLANYAVLTARQDLRGGDAGIDWIATAVQRDLDGVSAPWLHESAYVAGVSGRSRFGARNWEVAGGLAVSRVAGAPEAVARTQTGAVHYFQQPGDDPVVDSARTSLSGWTGQIKVGKYGGDITRFETSLVLTSPGFEPNDLGYLRRADMRDWSTWASLNFQSPTRAYRWARFNANTWHRWSTSGVKLESALNLNAHMGFHNNWDVHGGATFANLGRVACDRCSRGGPVLRRSPALYPWFGVNGDDRRAVQPGVWVNLGFWDDGRSRSTSIEPYLAFRFSSRLTARVGVEAFRAEDDSQWLGNFAGTGGAVHHAFAHLDQRTVSLQLRVNYTATPDLTLELYAEPFASSGVYTGVRELSATPVAADYEARFVPYTPPAGTATSFSFRQFQSNAVLRWEYSPGSTLFLVWAHGRRGYLENEPRRPWQDDLGELWDLPADDTFLLKVSYWLNR
ncbi:MAG TPA: DUF5916 domain-containing protein [Longimicrobiales bacterium]|nr:DUF5916 domain-containing protein [Longimicrobiales bacterium]